MAPAIRISAMESSTSYQEDFKPVSVSLLSEFADTTMLVSSDDRKRKRRSLPSGDMSIELARTFPSAGLSSSLDEESRMEEPLHESVSSPRSATKLFATTIDKRLSASFPSTFSKKNLQKQEPSSISIPKFKLKPRPKRRSSESETHMHCKTSRSSFKTPPPKIFVPFLPAHGRKQTFPEEAKQVQATQKPLPPPPLMPQLQASTTFTSPTRAKISYEMKEPELLLRPRKARRTMDESKQPLSSPPPLIPSFDFGVSATSRDAITPPPGATPAAASYMTPLSVMGTKTPLSMTSVGTPHKNIVVAKPIARRPLITPSTLHSSSKKESKIRKPLLFDCSPRRLFPSNFRHKNAATTNNNKNNNNIFSGRAGVGSSLLSSMESSAFSFSSSAPSSLLASTIRRTLSLDEEE